MAELAELSTSKIRWRGGRLLHIHIAPAASVKMEELAEANFVAGRGKSPRRTTLPAWAVLFGGRLNFPCKYLEKLLRASMSMARFWRDQGKRDEARELLAPVYGWFTEGFDTHDLKEAKALLDELA
jgi:predicted ATPase